MALNAEDIMFSVSWKLLGLDFESCLGLSTRMVGRFS